MEVHLVLTTYSHFEGEPLGVFSSKDLAEDFIAERVLQKGLHIWSFEVDEEVESQQTGTYFEVVCPGMELVDERWHGFLKGWFVGTIGLMIALIICSLR